MLFYNIVMLLMLYFMSYCKSNHRLQLLTEIKIKLILTKFKYECIKFFLCMHWKEIFHIVEVHEKYHFSPCAQIFRSTINLWVNLIENIATRTLPFWNGVLWISSGPLSAAIFSFCDIFDGTLMDPSNNLRTFSTCQNA